MLTIRKQSRKTIFSRITARQGGQYLDPTGDEVEATFTAEGESLDDAVWVAGTWQTDSTTTPPTYWAQCLVGPGGTVELDSGLYTLHFRITDDPEVPVLTSGLVRVVA